MLRFFLVRLFRRRPWWAAAPRYMQAAYGPIGLSAPTMLLVCLLGAAEAALSWSTSVPLPDGLVWVGVPWLAAFPAGSLLMFNCALRERLERLADTGRADVWRCLVVVAYVSSAGIQTSMATAGRETVLALACCFFVGVVCYTTGVIVAIDVVAIERNGSHYWTALGPDRRNWGATGLHRGRERVTGVDE